MILPAFSICPRASSTAGTYVSSGALPFFLMYRLRPRLDGTSTAWWVRNSSAFGLRSNVPPHSASGHQSIEGTALAGAAAARGAMLGVCWRQAASSDRVMARPMAMHEPSNAAGNCASGGMPRSPGRAGKSAGNAPGRAMATAALRWTRQRGLLTPVLLVWCR